MFGIMIYGKMISRGLGSEALCCGRIMGGRIILSVVRLRWVFRGLRLGRCVVADVVLTEMLLSPAEGECCKSRRRGRS